MKDFDNEDKKKLYNARKSGEMAALRLYNPKSEQVLREENRSDAEIVAYHTAYIKRHGKMMKNPDIVKISKNKRPILIAYSDVTNHRTIRNTGELLAYQFSQAQMKKYYTFYHAAKEKLENQNNRPLMEPELLALDTPTPPVSPTENIEMPFPALKAWENNLHLLTPREDNSTLEEALQEALDASFDVELLLILQDCRNTRKYTP